MLKMTQRSVNATTYIDRIISIEKIQIFGANQNAVWFYYSLMIDHIFYFIFNITRVCQMCGCDIILLCYIFWQHKQDNVFAFNSPEQQQPPLRWSSRSISLIAATSVIVEKQQTNCINHIAGDFEGMQRQYIQYAIGLRPGSRIRFERKTLKWNIAVTMKINCSHSK